MKGWALETGGSKLLPKKMVVDFNGVLGFLKRHICTGGDEMKRREQVLQVGSVGTKGSKGIDLDLYKS